MLCGTILCGIGKEMATAEATRSRNIKTAVNTSCGSLHFRIVKAFVH